MSAPRSAAQREPSIIVGSRIPPAERGRGRRCAASLPGEFMRLVVLILWGLTAASAVEAAVFQENFSANPAGNGWHSFGRGDLFQWDPANQNLRVTWDS